MNSIQRPERVLQAYELANKLGFELSCDDHVGQLLSVWAAALPYEARVLELGTGAGVGLSWLCEGTSTRADILLKSVEVDADTHREVSALKWPKQVDIVHASAESALQGSERYHLIFADSPVGKITHLEDTISCLEVGGVLIVDDMDLAQHDDDPELAEELKRVTHELETDFRLLTMRIDIGSGIMISARKNT